MFPRLLALSSLAMLAACASSATRSHRDWSAASEAAAILETPVSVWNFYRERYDSDGDGLIVRAEYTRSEDAFHHLDADRDKVVSADDFAMRWDGMPRTRGKALVPGEGGPGFGDLAPDFRLTTTTGEEIDLARFRGEKPVVLAFGSFT